MAPLARLTPYVATNRMIPIGVSDNDQTPVHADFDTDSHFLVFGEGQSGKTNLLRTLVHGITRQYTPQDAVVMLVDFRRSMLGYIDTQHLLAYAYSPTQLTDMMRDVASSLRRRLPGPDVTQEQLKNRSWWKGPELFLVVNDYELIATQGNYLLTPIREFLAEAKDIGLHVILAGRPIHESRASYDPIVSKLKERTTPGVVLSVPEDQGVQLGTYRPTTLPAGRGVMITRSGGQQHVQLTWTPDSER